MRIKWKINIRYNVPMVELFELWFSHGFSLIISNQTIHISAGFQSQILLYIWMKWSLQANFFGQNYLISWCVQIFQINKSHHISKSRLYQIINVICQIDSQWLIIKLPWMIIFTPIIIDRPFETCVRNYAAQNCLVSNKIVVELVSS